MYQTITQLLSISFSPNQSKPPAELWRYHSLPDFKRVCIFLERKEERNIYHLSYMNETLGWMPPAYPLLEMESATQAFARRLAILWFMGGWATK